MRLMMKLQSLFSIIARRNLYRRLQRYPHKLSRAIRVLLHLAESPVAILPDRHMIRRAQVQIPKHVAGGKTRDQQFFRIVAGPVSTKVRIARARNLSFALTRNRVIAAVSFIRLRPFSIVARPIHLHFVFMMFHAGSLFIIQNKRFLGREHLASEAESDRGWALERNED